MPWTGAAFLLLLGGLLSGCAGGDTSARLGRYIRADGASRLVLEVDAVEGHGPAADVTDRLTRGLGELLDKPAGIDVQRDDTLGPRGSDHGWTDAELRELARETFDLDVSEDTVKMHVLFLDGRHADDDDGSVTLGLAWAHTHMAIFAERLEDACTSGPLGPLRQQRLCENAELSVWTHEVGHTIGLVDNGLPMVEDHRDDGHGAHDENDQCVMYWAYEGERVVERLRERIMGGNDNALRFDEACRQDVAAVRDR